MTRIMAVEAVDKYNGEGSVNLGVKSNSRIIRLNRFYREAPNIVPGR